MDRKPRYEYRVWAETLTEVANDLQRLASSSEREPVSEETYLISANTDECNAKIRGGRMNVKALLATERSLELWSPVLDVKFPLQSSIIVDQILSRLKVPAPKLHSQRYSISAFLDELIRPELQIEIVKTAKRRIRFELDDCLAEFTTVRIGEVVRETIELELVDPDPVLLRINQLRLAGLPNLSYVRQLKRMLSDCRYTG